MTKLTIHNTENIEVSESLHNWGRCITVSIKSEDHNGHSTTTDIELFTKYPDKPFQELIQQEVIV